MMFSMTKPVDNGAWLGKDGYLNLSYRGVSVPILHRDEIKLIGDHNVANYLAAICAVWGYVGADTIRKVAAEFAGVEHRIELVREKNGVKYYNDSIASSPTRTIAGLKALNSSNVVLLAGGYDKHIPFEPLAPYINKYVKVLILCGPTSDKIEAAVRADKDFDEKHLKIFHAKDMEEQVKTAERESKPGDIVILSPACASFDAFPNFMVRGDTYKSYVNAL